MRAVPGGRFRPSSRLLESRQVAGKKCRNRPLDRPRLSEFSPERENSHAASSITACMPVTHAVLREGIRKASRGEVGERITRGSVGHRDITREPCRWNDLAHCLRA
jgi:hypothetical protein